MPVRRIDGAHLTPAKRWALRVCFCLLAMMLLLQALHLHPNELAQTDVKHCAICQVVHAPIQVAPIPHINFGLTKAGVLSFSVDPHPRPVLASFSLFSRPPPLV